MSRIKPLTPPFSPDVDATLTAMMPDGVPPIALFRTFVHNMPMADAMRGWGSYELSKRLSLSMRQRELVIDRTTARCGCDYEWGVHVMFFAERVGFTPAQVTSVTHGSPTDPCWTDPAEQALLALVDSLHETSDVDDDTWAFAEAFLDACQLLDVCLLTGWYHAISFAANAARVPLEDEAPRFIDVE